MSPSPSRKSTRPRRPPAPAPEPPRLATAELDAANDQAWAETLGHSEAETPAVLGRPAEPVAPLALVYFVRRFPPNVPRFSQELRYSLRSAEANVSNLGEVHIFGGRPDWLTTAAVHHPVKQAGGKHDNTWANWCAIADAAHRGELPERFVIMNDDFFVVEPIEDVPLMYHGTVKDWITARRYGGADHAAGVMTYTSEVLRQLGVPEAEQLAFELHVPMPVREPGLWEAMQRLRPAVRRGVRIAKRSAVANLAGWQGDAVPSKGDVKVREPDEPMPAGPFWSTSDESFTRRPHTASMGPRSARKLSMGDRIREAFPSPSRFEQVR